MHNNFPTRLRLRSDLSFRVSSDSCKVSLSSLVRSDLGLSVVKVEVSLLVPISSWYFLRFSVTQNYETISMSKWPWRGSSDPSELLVVVSGATLYVCAPVSRKAVPVFQRMRGVLVVMVVRFKSLRCQNRPTECTATAASTLILKIFLRDSSIWTDGESESS